MYTFPFILLFLSRTRDSLFGSKAGRQKQEDVIFLVFKIRWRALNGRYGVYTEEKAKASSLNEQSYASETRRAAYQLRISSLRESIN